MEVRAVFKKGEAHVASRLLTSLFRQLKPGETVTILTDGDGQAVAAKPTTPASNKSKFTRKEPKETPYPQQRKLMLELCEHLAKSNPALTQKAIAKLAGIKRSTFGTLVRGRYPLNRDQIDLLMRAFKLERTQPIVARLLGVVEP